ncbi:2-amino-4-hydroxy-6-hydroxymethyldihydropteridine diphosphokinase [Paenibacillus sediminis]|nr:2-amino-4-hydroxy-6-hydroxymethyldihydropteridine diphosphokinase [Paenibacillus sediminis]
MAVYTSSERSEAYIALGANLGDREGTLISAIDRLDAHPQINVLRCSSLYETDPVGYVDQPSFLNMAASLRTSLKPKELLNVMLDTERELGRVRTIRWGPRTVDLDLLWFGGIVLETEELILPHPRMAERAFVLVPLSEIVQADEQPDLYTFVQSALHKLDGKDGVQRWKAFSWPRESEHFES